MVGPLGGDAGDLRAPTINTKNVDDGPSEIREHPPSKLNNVDGGPLGGVVRDLGAPTINVKNVDGGPPGRWC
jgi:hypothetical protein